MRRIYLDHMSGMPIDKRVLDVMRPYLDTHYGNPSSTHGFGNEARQAIDDARNKVATLVGAETKEIFFTSGGTESNNLAIKGVAYRNKNKGNHIITSSIDHMSVINPCKDLSKQGFNVTYLPVDPYGTVNVEALKDAVTDKTILVSIMYANNEIGTIEPISEISEIVHDKGGLLHVDAVAAAGQIRIEVQKDNIDLLSLSSNDLYGPRGTGALYVKTRTRIQPIILGGGQERGIRSGTENVAGIAGMGAAAELATSEIPLEAARLTKLRDRFIQELLESIPKSYLNGHPTKRLPNNVNIRFSYIEGESLLLSLDMEGVAASSGSACTSKTLEPSHVLLATGLKHEEAHGSLLFTLGRQNTDEDVTYVVELLPGIVKRLRAISPLTPKELI
ncbi:cysteine desulfurase NifS [Candidatus Bathyarchaeota archaeon]|nr:MAG: cysteine desulfurase NifS [Candidatus Bathyarchaeota archaeon]